MTMRPAPALLPASLAAAAAAASAATDDANAVAVATTKQKPVQSTWTYFIVILNWLYATQ